MRTERETISEKLNTVYLSFRVRRFALIRSAPDASFVDALRRFSVRWRTSFKAANIPELTQEKHAKDHVNKRDRD